MLTPNKRVDRMDDDYRNPKPGNTYISPSLPSFRDENKRVRIASKVVESQSEYSFGVIRSEAVLREKPGAATHIKAKFVELERNIYVLSIQKFKAEEGGPYGAGFSFVGSEIQTLYNFLEHCKEISLKSRASLIIPDNQLRRLVLSKQQAERLIEDNEDVFTEALASTITRQDVVAIAYRKSELEKFRLLLNDTSYFSDVKKREALSDEAVWQSFFERNPWIFGYGLSYIYLDSLLDQRLEQVVRGHRIGAAGKRIDALMVTKGLISSLCFVEIKTHNTRLLREKEYRSGCWAPSQELSGAVSQVQGTVASAMDSIRDKLHMVDPEGYPVADAYNHMPRSYLICGSLAEFVNESGVSDNRFRSFELFRRNTSSPEIITFDELYERARFIVNQNDDG